MHFNGPACNNSCPDPIVTTSVGGLHNKSHPTVGPFGKVQPQHGLRAVSQVKRLAQMNESLMGSKSKYKSDRLRRRATNLIAGIFQI